MKFPNRRNPGMEKINTVIPKSMHSLGKKIERAYQERFVLFQWPKIVGKTVAVHVWPLAVEGEKLVLYTSAPAWRNEILLMQMMILDRVNQFAGYEMVKELTFSWKKNEVYHRVASTKEEKEDDVEEKEQQEYQAALQKMVLTASEREECQRDIFVVTNKKLRMKLLHLLEMKKKSEKIRQALGEHPCPHCGRRIKKDGFCLSCARENKKEKRRLIRRSLLDRPWARYVEIQAYVPCTPAMLASERSRLAQELARRVVFGDWESLEAKTLVMLYRSLRPEQLTEEILRSTLYDLRREMAEEIVFRPFPKRSVFFSRASEKRRRRDVHVSSSRR